LRFRIRRLLGGQLLSHFQALAPRRKRFVQLALAMEDLAYRFIAYCNNVDYSRNSDE
jgi:hypothetical protein